MIINTNMNALAAYRNMNSSIKKSGNSMQKLSSGYKINSAADDAAGLSISEKMRAQIRGLDKAANNAQNTISLLQTAEGALTETESMIQRMRELAVQGATETNTLEDNEVLDKELKLLMEEIDRSAETTQFNTKLLLDGSFGAKGTAGATLTEANGVEGFDINSTQLGTLSFQSGGTAGGPYSLTVTWTDSTDPTNTKTQVINDIPAIGTGETISVNFDELGFKIELNENFDETSLNTAGTDTITVEPGSSKFQVGANANQTIEFTMRDMRARGSVLNLNSVNLLTVADSQNAIKELDRALSEVSMERAKIGALSNRIEHTVNNLMVSSENLTAAESRIRDVDMAKEMMTYSKFNILQQSSQAMLAQANQQPQGILQLLQQ